MSSVILLCVQFLNTNSSYKGCYSTKETPVSNFDMAFNIEDKCQFSYQEPFDENITRHDYYLNFNQNPKNNESIEYTNWDLYFSIKLVLIFMIKIFMEEPTILI